MIKALIYKEWLKTKWFIVAIITINIALLLYSCFSTLHIFRLANIYSVWDVIVNRNQFLFSNLRYLPIISAMLLATAQYIPEVSKKRLKLTLHLPINQTKALFSMIGFGIVVLMITFIFQSSILFVFTQKYFATEIVKSIFSTIFPWYMAGISSYVLIAFICLEPTWRNRVVYSLITIAIADVFLLSDFPESYSKIWYITVAIFLIVLPLPMLSIKRFKKGLQDSF